MIIIIKQISHAWPDEQTNMCSSVQKKQKKKHTPTVHLLYQSTLMAWKKRPQQSLSLFIRSWVHTHTVHTLTHSHWGAWCKCHSGLRWLLCWLCTLGGCSRKGCIQFLELREGGRNEMCCMLCCSTARQILKLWKKKKNPVNWFTSSAAHHWDMVFAYHVL